MTKDIIKNNFNIIYKTIQELTSKYTFLLVILIVEDLKTNKNKLKKSHSWYKYICLSL